jgi:DNA-binding MarR family transcriptional regulator
VSSNVPQIEGNRAQLLDALRSVGRAHSDATVFFHAGVAERLGLNPTDEKAMSILERDGPLTAGQIAQRTGLATPSVTDLIDRLERKGYVRRTRDPRDRRRIIVEPDAGRIEQIAPIFESPMRSLAQLLARYSDEELAVILDFLRRDAERLHGEAIKLGRASSKLDEQRPDE